jgi:DNA-binding transcriptional LysR family regulator
LSLLLIFVVMLSRPWSSARRSTTSFCLLPELRETELTDPSAQGSWDEIGDREADLVRRAAGNGALGVRLLDRSANGVEPTIYGAALLKRSVTVFDELKQSVRDIEFLADPTVGELRIGFTEALAATILPEVLVRFSQQYPGVAVHLDDVSARTMEAPGPGLRERKYDCVLQRMTAFPGKQAIDDLNVELLFDNKFVVVAPANTRWAVHRQIDLAELVDESWILPPPGTWDYACVTEAFRARGLEAPKSSLYTVSIGLRTRLLSVGPYLTIIADSVMRRFTAERCALTALPVELKAPSWSAVIVTLKNRTLSPAVERFIACTSEVAKSFGSSSSSIGHKSRSASASRRS